MGLNLSSVKSKHSYDTQCSSIIADDVYTSDGLESSMNGYGGGGGNPSSLGADDIPGLGQYDDFHTIDWQRDIARDRMRHRFIVKKRRDSLWECIKAWFLWNIYFLILGFKWSHLTPMHCLSRVTLSDVALPTAAYSSGREGHGYGPISGINLASPQVLFRILAFYSSHWPSDIT